MRNPNSRILLAVVALISAALPVAAQNRERFGISAKAGGINVVVGRVMVTREGQEPQLLTNKEDIAAGETVTTGSSSNAEILLNPGSYLRLAEKSEFRFEDISLDNLRLRLVKGSAIIEATGVADMNLGIRIVTPHAEFTIIRTGVYRVNVQPESSELAVRNGRASFGPSQTDIVKGGNAITIGKGFAARAKLSKDKDEFELWSKQRAELLAKANARLSSRLLNGYLTSFTGWDSWFWGPRRFGIWTFSPRAGCYTFLPFFYGWSSPYGHYYDSYYGGFYWAGGSCCNNGIFARPGVIVSSGSPSGGSGGSVTPGGAPAPAPGPPPTQISPGRGVPREESGERIIRKNDP